MTTALEDAMFSTLGGYQGVKDLVGARIYEDQAPQAVAKPYIVWQLISESEANDLDGSAVSGGVENPRVQVSSWAVKKSDAAVLDRQARAAMAVATAFKSLKVDARGLPFEPDTKLFGAQTDFSVWLKT